MKNKHTIYLDNYIWVVLDSKALSEAVYQNTVHIYTNVYKTQKEFNDKLLAYRQLEAKR